MFSLEGLPQTLWILPDIRKNIGVRLSESITSSRLKRLHPNLPGARVYIGSAMIFVRVYASAWLGIIMYFVCRRTMGQRSYWPFCTREWISLQN